jgi:hypothetical protein
MKFRRESRRVAIFRRRAEIPVTAVHGGDGVDAYLSSAHESRLLARIIRESCAFTNNAG